MTSPVVSVSRLRKSYGNLPAVDDVSFEVERGEIFALLGPNGAGKTTSIEILEGFQRRDGGDVEVLGFDPGDRRTQSQLRSRLGVVLQELAVEPYFSVRQVLERNAGFYSSPRSVDEVIELVGLTEKADSKIKRLSGGQMRRLDIGLGIVGNPELLFLDEPTTGLDPAARRTTWELVRTLCAEGTTVVLSSHYMDEVDALARHVAVLSHGRIVATGTPSSLGGRDHGSATIRFTLPESATVTDLPIAPTTMNGSVVVIVTDEEIAVLALLTNWAVQGHIAIAGLTVTRLTLEDIYLELTRESHDQEGDS
jgi:ABC-2 type transport system ATP-binding protein